MRAGMFVLVLIAGTAHHATAAEPPSRAQKAKLELHKRAAEKASAEGNFAEAVAQLDQALRVAANEPELLLSLARAYDEWGNHCSDALEQLKRFFAACGACALKDRGGSEQSLIANRCASDVTVESDPPGAIVQIAGDEYARVAPFTTQLKPGAYAIDVRRHGYVARKIQLAVEPATPQKVPVSLEVDPVLLARPENKPPPDAKLIAPPIAAERSTSAATYVALGTGVAGGVAGVLCTMSAIDTVDEEREARFAGAPESEIEALRSSAKTRAALAYAGFGVSIAAFAAAAAIDALLE